jgi:hypothetical protein
MLTSVPGNYEIYIYFTVSNLTSLILITYHIKYFEILVHKFCLLTEINKRINQTEDKQNFTLEILFPRRKFRHYCKIFFCDTIIITILTLLLDFINYFQVSKNIFNVVRAIT